MKIIDITGTIKNGMWSYGSPLPDVEIKEVSRLSDNGESSFSMLLGPISGTYLETDVHRLYNQTALIDVPVRKMITTAFVFKLQDKEPFGHVTLDELISSNIKVREGSTIFVRTGWDRMWDKPNFIKESPHFAKEAMEWLLDKITKSQAKLIVLPPRIEKVCGCPCRAIIIEE